MTTLLRLIHSQTLPPAPVQAPLVAGAPFQPGGHRMVAPITVQSPGRKLFSATKNMLEEEDPIVIPDGDRGLVLKGSSYRAFGEVPKQDVYIPFRNVLFPSLAGFIDLFLTNRVIGSRADGVISRLLAEGLVTSVVLDTADLAAPVIVTADVDTPTPGDVSIGGSNFESVSPLESEVRFASPAATFTKTAILGAGGAFSDTAIVIPAAIVPPGSTLGGTTVQVFADGQLSNIVPLAEADAPVITSIDVDNPNALGDLEIVGSNFVSFPPGGSGVILAGPFPSLFIPEGVIVGFGGTFTDTLILIPAAFLSAFFPTSAVGLTTVDVLADGLTSGVTPVAEAQFPFIGLADLDVPGAGDLTITGVDFESWQAGVSTVTLLGAGATVLTKAAIIGGGGIFTDGLIVIPAVLIPGALVAATAAVVTADTLASGPPFPLV